MNVKSMLVGFLIAVVASTGTYFLVPPPGTAVAHFESESNDARKIVSAMADIAKLETMLVQDSLNALGDRHKLYLSLSTDLKRTNEMLIELAPELTQEGLISKRNWDEINKSYKGD